jgi:hypothetical protein
MAKESWMTTITALAKAHGGVFRGGDAVLRGVSRDRLTTLTKNGVIDRVLPDTYRVAAVAPSPRNALVAALLWAGDDAAAAGQSGGEVYRFEGVRATVPEIVVPSGVRRRAPSVRVHRSDDRAALMIREVDGVRVTGVEATLLALAATLDGEALEIACEDARRRGLTGVPALRAYLPASRPCARSSLRSIRSGRRARRSR